MPKSMSRRNLIGPIKLSGFRLRNPESYYNAVRVAFEGLNLNIIKTEDLHFCRYCRPPWFSARPAAAQGVAAMRCALPLVGEFLRN